MAPASAVDLVVDEIDDLARATPVVLNEVIEALRQEPSNSERGTKFEKLMVRYFQLDPMLSQQYDEVCRWIDWPDRVGKADTGIDLVARERDTGAYTAIQCKFYEPTTTLAKDHIDSFFTASGKKPFTNRVIVSTTDKWGKNAEEALEGQTIPVQRIGLAEIADSPVDWDVAWPPEGLQIKLSEAKRPGDSHTSCPLSGGAGTGRAGGDSRVSHRVLASRRSATVSRSKTSVAR